MILLRVIWILPLGLGWCYTTPLDLGIPREPEATTPLRSAQSARRRRDFRGVLPEDGPEVCQSGPRNSETDDFSYTSHLGGLLYHRWIVLGEGIGLIWVPQSTADISLEFLEMLLGQYGPIYLRLCSKGPQACDMHLTLDTLPTKRFQCVNWSLFCPEAPKHVSTLK